MLGRDGGYSTFGYFQNDKNRWVETFNTGLQFEWVIEDGNIYMVNLSATGEQQRRNQWVVVDEDTFLILEQFSNDNGQTWQQRSETRVERR